MNQPPVIKLTDRAVRDMAVDRLEKHLPLTVAGYECTTEMVLDVLIKAAVTRQTIEAVCQDLEVSTSNTIRTYLNDQIQADDLAELERRVNATLVEGVPPQVWAKAWNVAFDFHDEPFYGKSPELLAYACGGEARAGTTRFYRVATAYVMAKNDRVTLALLFVRPEDTIPEILACLIRRLRILGLQVLRLLLDKGFCTIPVLRHVAASGWSAILACPIRGKQGGTKALCHGRSSYRSQHTFRSQEYGEFTAAVVVVRTFTSHRRSKRGQRRLRWLIYVVFQCDDLSLRQIRRLYRRRFGIEASYRCMRQVRAWTTSRNAALRFLLISLGFILVNLWQELRWRCCQVPRRGGRKLDANRFKLQRMASFLNRAIEAIYGTISFIEVQVQPLGP
jgi:putative transposase